MNDFSGIYTALVTPFLGGAIDVESLKKLVRSQLDKGIEGFVVCGTTAESPCLSSAEKKQIFEIVRTEVAGQVPLIVGTGSNNTVETVHATKEAYAWGAAAALVVVPYYNKPPQRGLLAHFKAVAAASPMPILLYNVPGRSIVRLEAETIAELSRVPNIVGIKEATGDIAFGRRVIEVSRPGFAVTSGDDGTFLELTEAGGVGLIGVASHILPGEFVSWNRMARAGKHDEWRKEFLRFKELIDYLYVEANPIPVKAALAMMNLISSAEMRLPLLSLAEPHLSELRRKMASAGLL